MHHESLEAWAKGVFNAENDCVFYLRKESLSFEEFTNSSIESSYRAVKDGPSKVEPQMDLDKAGERLLKQAEGFYNRFLADLQTDRWENACHRCFQCFSHRFL